MNKVDLERMMRNRTIRIVEGGKVRCARVTRTGNLLKSANGHTYMEVTLESGLFTIYTDEYLEEYGVQTHVDGIRVNGVEYCVGR